MLSQLLAGLRFWAATMYSHVSAMEAWRAIDFGSTSLGMRGSVDVSAALFNDRIIYIPPLLLIKYGNFGSSVEAKKNIMLYITSHKTNVMLHII